MPIRPETHRASTLKRRDALLAAAVELVAEQGLHGVTHREVARRAGLPPSTTSYFFASLDELVAEAVGRLIEELCARLDALSAQLRGAELDVDEILDLVVPPLLAVPAGHVAAQFHTYLAVPHHAAWRDGVERLLAALDRAVAAQLDALGLPSGRADVRRVIALADGFQLQRLSGVDPEHVREDLTAALRVLFTAARPAP